MKLAPRREAFRLALGRRGEIAAWNFLIQRGYRLLEKNYRCPLGEIDAVAMRDGRIVFIEIKTRTSHDFGRPEESVHAAKQRKLIKLAQYYLKAKAATDARASFAVVAVTHRLGGAHEIKLIEDAFSAGG